MPMITYGSAMQQIASGGSTEDSALAIELCLLASWRGETAPADLLEDYKTKFHPWSFHRITISHRRVYVPVLGRAILSGDGRRAINPFAAAFFSESFLQRLGIPTAHSRIEAAAEARKLLASRVIVKFSRGSKLRWNSTPTDGDGFALVCDLIEDAASVDFIRRTKLSADEADTRVGDIYSSFLSPSSGRGLADARVVRAVQTLSKICALSDSLFVGVELSDAQIRKARLVAEFVSEEWFRIAIARIFIGTTAPHFANVLTTKSGALISIDHDSARFETGDDLKMLFKFVRRGSSVFDLLGRIARLGEDDIRAAVEAIPRHRACGSTDGLSDYFVARLRLWRSLYEAAPSRALAQAAV